VNTCGCKERCGHPAGGDGAVVLPGVDPYAVMPWLRDFKLTPRPGSPSETVSVRSELAGTGSEGKAGVERGVPPKGTRFIDDMVVPFPRPGTRGRLGAPRRRGEPRTLESDIDEPEFFRRKRIRELKRMYPTRPVGFAAPCTDALPQTFPPGPRLWPLPPDGFTSDYSFATFGSRIDWVLDRGHSQSLLDSLYPPAPPYLGISPNGDRSRTFERFLARWWLYGVPARCSREEDGWLAYRGHWVRRDRVDGFDGAPGGFDVSRRTELQLCIDLLRLSYDAYESFTFTEENGAQGTIEIGARLKSIIRGGETVAFLLVADGHPFLDGGAARYWDLSNDSMTQFGDGLGGQFTDWLSVLEVPPDAEHLIMLSGYFWRNGHPGSYADGPEQGLWILPRRNASYARTARVSPFLTRAYLASLGSLGLTPIPAGENFLLFTAWGTQLQDWLTLLSGVAHELTHAAFASAGRDSAGDPCDVDITATELARRPTPNNSMSFHAATHTIGSEAAEVAVLGRPTGWLTHTQCCRFISIGFADPALYAGSCTA
jgi:hypothetical protein